MSGAFLDNDLDAVFDTGDFSISGVLTSASTGKSKNVTGNFDDEDVMVDRGDGREVLQKAARFETKTAHAATVGDVLELAHSAGKITYTIEVVQDGGTGTTTLWLRTS